MNVKTGHTCTCKSHNDSAPPPYCHSNIAYLCKIIYCIIVCLCKTIQMTWTKCVQIRYIKGTVMWDLLLQVFLKINYSNRSNLRYPQRILMFLRNLRYIQIWKRLPCPIVCGESTVNRGESEGVRQMYTQESFFSFPQILSPCHSPSGDNHSKNSLIVDIISQSVSSLKMFYRIPDDQELILNISR